MSFKETMDSIKVFMDSLEGRDFLGPSRDKFIKIVYEMERQFSFMENSDEKPVVDNCLSSDVMFSFDFIQSKYMTSIITDKNYKFVKSFLLLINNWNCNVGNNNEMQSRITFLSNLYDNHMTVVDSFNVLKALISRCEKLQRFALPSVELSRHYLKSLDEENEKK